MTDEKDDSIAGEIFFAESHSAKPMFRRVRHDFDAETAGANVRPCNHGEFVCDEKFSTVTCGRCDTQVLPFDALMVLVEYWDRIRNSAAILERTTADLNRAELRRLARLRCFDDAERARIGTAIRDPRLTARQLAEVCDTYGTIADKRKDDRRRRAQRTLAPGM